jgi:hypothetical protein
VEPPQRFGTETPPLRRCWTDVSRCRTIRASLAAAAGVLALLACAAPGVAAPAPWATVNVCDTTGHPDGIGIRGSMPGTGDKRDELFMRLQLQFLRRSDGSWRALGGSGDSGFVDVGNGAARTRQTGRTFTLSPPGSGQSAFVLRGVVTFEWRRDGDVVRRARRATTAGHPGTPGADPDDYSAATCSIR